MNKKMSKMLLACGALVLTSGSGGILSQTVQACLNPATNIANSKLPSKYDPRPWSTPIRNQHAPNGDNQNLCWSYSGNDMLTYAKQKTFGITTVYSPNYTNYATAWDAMEYEDSTPSSRHYVTNPTSNPEHPLNWGGHVAAASIFALLGNNPVRESDFSSTDENGFATGTVASTPISSAELDAARSKADNSYSVTDVNRVGYEDGITTHEGHIKELKKAIINNGSVGYAFNALTLHVGQEDYMPGYYDEKNNALNTIEDDKNEIEYINHATLIVGYDDNYSKDKFNPEHRPQNNGAFLVRNSWGTEFGENGYFWVSYEDYYIQVSVGASSVEIGQKLSGIAQSLQKTTPQNNPFYVAYPDWSKYKDFENQSEIEKNQDSDIVLGTHFPAKDHKLILNSVAIDTDLDDVDYEVYLVDGAFSQSEKLTELKTQGQLIKKGHEVRQGIHRKTIKPVDIPADQDYSLVVIEKATDKSINNKAASLFVSNNSKGSYRQNSWMGYLQSDEKIKWIDLGSVATRSTGGASATSSGVLPYIFAYSTAE
jgi:hypothetical protein